MKKITSSSSCSATSPLEVNLLAYNDLGIEAVMSGRGQDKRSGR